MLSTSTSIPAAIDTDKPKPAGPYAVGRAKTNANKMFKTMVKIETNNGVLVSFWA